MNTLENLMGGESCEYVKLFDLTLLLEAFLTSPILTKDEVDAVEKFIPKFVGDFCKCVAWEQGRKM